MPFICVRPTAAYGTTLRAEVDWPTHLALVPEAISRLACIAQRRRSGYVSCDLGQFRCDRRPSKSQEDFVTTRGMESQLYRVDWMGAAEPGLRSSVRLHFLSVSRQDRGFNQTAKHSTD